MNEPTDAELAEARATDPDFAEKMKGLVRKRKKAQQDHRQRYLKQFSKAYYAANKEVINARGKAHRKKCKERKAKIRSQWKQKYYETRERREREICEKLAQSGYGDHKRRKATSAAVAQVPPLETETGVEHLSLTPDQVV